MPCVGRPVPEVRRGLLLLLYIYNDTHAPAGLHRPPIVLGVSSFTIPRGRRQ